MREFCLNGDWKLVASSVEKNNYGIGNGSSFVMSIPGSVQDALIDQAIVPDPYLGCNELEDLFIGRSDWNISRSFELAFDSSKHYILHLSKVDTVASLYINDSLVCSFDNEHRIFDLDVSSFLVVGTNSIEFRFTSSEKLANERASKLDHPAPCSRYKYDSPNRNLVRKAQCNAAWDWGLCLQTIGIHEDVILYECDSVYLSSFSAIPKRSGDDWELRIKARIRAFRDCVLPVTASVAGYSSSVDAPLVPGENAVEFSIAVPASSVELWWPNGLGEQKLYDVLICVDGFEKHRKIGFRTIEVKNQNTMGGKELTVCVNGLDVFCKGANWIPLDARPALQSIERYDAIIRDVRDANMNMLRLWGGGWFEREAFYDACDRYGILIWHDLMFSCSTYPADKWFLDSVEAEVRDQVRRLSSRTCIALWCGNNECLGALGWYPETMANLPLYIKDYETLYVNWIDKILVEEDPSRMYWPSSPCAGPGDYSDNWHTDGNGDMHYWTVWHERKDFEFYHSVKPRFCSEFGYQSFPSLSEVASFAVPEDYDIHSAVMDHHQRNEEGNSIIEEMFGRYFKAPKDFASTLYLSQVQQAYAIETAVTYWRSLMPYCMGTLYWQLNDVWPVSSWSSIEYSGKWKALHYAARRFYSSACPLIYIEDGKLYVKVANDGPDTVCGDLLVSIVDFDGNVLRSEKTAICVERLSVLSGIVLNMEELDREGTFMCASFGTVENVLLLCRPKDAYLQNPGLEVVSVTEANGGFDVVLSSERPAFYVTLDAGNIRGRFDDNFFALNGERKVHFDCYEDVTAEEFSSGLCVRDLYSSFSDGGCENG